MADDTNYVILLENTIHTMGHVSQTQLDMCPQVSQGLLDMRSKRFLYISIYLQETAGRVLRIPCAHLIRCCR